ncbi:hypothetical protein HGB07_10170 [Candidatus Roizmanbacteria bacterium]|nr:hypothetical protein [Candidatus Roizmanbacteria bacterium]
MKKSIIIAMSVLLVSATSFVFAGEGGPNKDKFAMEGVAIQKTADSCKIESDTLQQRIKKIRAEIKKGSKMYSAEGLKKLEQQLKDANATMKTLTEPN